MSRVASGCYEMHCRENLFIVFKLCCLSLPARLAVPPNFTVNIPGLSSDHDEFNSSIKCVQSSLSGIPNVSGLFSNPRTISPILTLLGRGRALLEDAFVFCLGRSSFMFFSPSTISKQTGVSLHLYCF